MGRKQVQVLDKKFVIAACVIGIAYTAIILLVNWIVGKEGAGVAGVALTVLAIAIFRQFETLRFKILRESEGTDIVVPRLSPPRIALICFSLVGAQTLFSMFVGSALNALKIAPDLSSIAELFDLLRDWRAFTIWIGVKLIACFFVGFLIPKCFRLSLYSDVAVATLLAMALPDLIPLTLVAIKTPSEFKALFESGVFQLWIATFWVVFIAVTVGGARAGVRSSN